MKTLTKEWLKDIDFHDLIVTLTPNSKKKIPYVFTNGGTECIAKEDLYTVKTNFNVTDIENELNFVMLPDTFELDSEEINEETCKNNFLIKYLNRLRVISYLPEDIIKRVKDKRMLALGYAESNAKDKILEYTLKKYRKALGLYENTKDTFYKVEKELTIYRQLKQHRYINSFTYMLDEAEITDCKTDGNGIRLTIDNDKTIILSDVQIIEQENSPVNSIVRAYELYENEGYELHLLLVKRDGNFIENSFYVTYKFKDMAFKED